jgi:hypothetical protein
MAHLKNILNFKSLYTKKALFITRRVYNVYIDFTLISLQHVSVLDHRQVAHT